MSELDLLVPALGWALLHFIWQGLLIGALAAVALAALRGADARLRYAVCALALLACLLLPSGHLLWLLSERQSASAPPALPGWLAGLVAQLPALVSAWSLGVGLMGLRLGLGLAWVARLRRRALPAPAEWQARQDALARRLGLRRAVPLRLSPAGSLDAPVAIGCLKPLVLLPAALLSGLPVPLLEALLAHELAHVRRQDYLAHLLQSLVEALLFFHPVVWWLSSRLRQERELVADALAARALDDPRRLAQALHALAELDVRAGPAAQDIRPLPPMAMSARGGRLLPRIEQLMTMVMMSSSDSRVAGWKLALPALLLAGSSLLVQAARGPAENAASPVPPPDAAVAPQHQHAGKVVELPAEPGSMAALLKLPVNARHMLVLDEDGRVLASKAPDVVVPIASLTKLLTAMVVLDARQDMDETLQVTAEDVDRLKHSASRLPVGARMSRRDALALALISSENRAASALARSYPGGPEGFARAAQAKLAALGLNQSRVVEPTGLSPANVSTAKELARLAAAAARYPQIAEISSRAKTKVSVNGRPRELRNTNHLVGGKGWDIRLSKTGYTEEAGRCLTMRLLAEGKQGVRHFVTVVLLDADGSAQRLADARRIRQSLGKLGG